MPLFLLTVFGKNEKANLTASEKNQLKLICKEISKPWIIKMTEAFESIKKDLLEAKSLSEGKAIKAKVHHIEVPAPDVAKIRSKSGLSQANFAKSIGVAVGTLQGWEQGRRAPQGPTRILLALIDKQPTIIQDALAS